MDSKALAKSKRAHSLHHSKKSHPHPKPKPATGGAGASKATSEKPAQQLRQPRPAPSLPSNWDRYEEEPDSDAGVPYGEVTGQSSELPLPKSKGADYRHLISEAKSQPQSHFDPHLDIFPSIDDVLPGFSDEGAGPLLSARGEAIVSRAKDDSFMIEEKATGSHEMPFLSLNLNALAEQLTKVDLAKRLFIEADLLPPEMLTEASASGSDREPAQVQSGKAEAAVERSGDLNWDDFTVERTKQGENIRGSEAQKPTFAANQMAVDTSRLHPHNQIIAPESSNLSPANAVAELKSKPSKFKAAAAEAELDALLDSLNDTKLTDKFDFSTSKSALNSEEKSSKISREMSSRGQKSSKAVPDHSTSNIDVLLDDLLEETSKLSKQNGIRAAEASAPDVMARSKVLDDFDSCKLSAQILNNEAVAA